MFCFPLFPFVLAYRFIFAILRTLFCLLHILLSILFLHPSYKALLICSFFFLSSGRCLQYLALRTLFFFPLSRFCASAYFASSVLPSFFLFYFTCNVEFSLRTLFCFPLFRPSVCLPFQPFQLLLANQCIIFCSCTLFFFIELSLRTAHIVLPSSVSPAACLT